MTRTSGQPEGRGAGAVVPNNPGRGTRQPPAAIEMAHAGEAFARLRGTQDRVADTITAFAGRIEFVYLHAIWFAGWILVNLGVFGDATIFDRYPFGLLTMIVSLEAIFLSTFVMVSQNRQSARDTVRADIDFETNLRSEVWSTHIGQALGLDPRQVERDVQRLIVESRARLAGNGTTPPSSTATGASGGPPATDGPGNAASPA